MKITTEGKKHIFSSSVEGNNSSVEVFEHYDGNMGLIVKGPDGVAIAGIIGGQASFQKGINTYLSSGAVVATATPVEDGEPPVNEYVLGENMSQVITTPDGHTRLWVNVGGTLKSIEF